MSDDRYTITVEIDDANGTLKTEQEARDFANSIGAGANHQWLMSLTPAVEVLEVRASAGAPRRPHERARVQDEALLQIQHIAHAAGLFSGPAEADRAKSCSASGSCLTLASALQRIAAIAEACEPDQHWRRPSEDESGDILAGGDQAPTESVPAKETAEVYTAQVAGREDGLYVFSAIADRDAFVTAVESGGGTAIPGSEPLNDGLGAQALIAAETEPRAFEIDALVRVEAPDPERAYKLANELVDGLADGTNGRAHLALLEGCEEVDER